MTATSASSPEIRALLVEDDEDQAQLISELLEEEAAVRPQVVGSLAEARAVMDELSYDAVFLDLGLPDSHGLDTLEAFLPDAVGAAVIVLTAGIEGRTGVDAIELGAEDYLEKSRLDPSRLRRSLQYSVQRKRQRAELERRTADLETLTSALGHDLRSPLETVDRLLAYVVEDLGANPPPEALRTLELARNVTDECRHRVEGLLELASVGMRELELRPVALDDVLAGVLATRIDSQKVTVEPLPMVLGDAALLGSLFSNLIENGLKYTRDESSVTVCATTVQDSVTVSVRDTGMGIPAKMLSCIFDPFRRGVAKTEFSGHGLGLTLCKRIADLHRGAIWAESEEGSGTTLFVSLRAVPE